MSLKIAYPICCGIDIHKTFVVACIASTNQKGVTTYKRHRFSTFTHPKYVKAIRGKKTGKKDAKWIADLFKHDLVIGSFSLLSLFDNSEILCAIAQS